MDFALGLLALATISTGIAIAVMSARGIERMRGQRSTLASDTPNTRAEMMPAE